MSRAKTKSKNPLKRFWDLLFKPSMPIYQDEPKKVAATRKSAGKEKATKQNPKKKTKAKNADLSLMSSQELGERIGFIDKAGVVRLKATSKEVGRLAEGEDREGALGRFIDIFKDHETALTSLQAKGDELSAADFEDIQRLKAQIAEQPGLGDASKLDQLLQSVGSKLNDNETRLRAEKVKLLQEIDKLPIAGSDGEIHWTGADKQLETIITNWEQTPKLEAKAQESLNHRLDATVRAYKDRKYAFYNDHEGNKKLKEKLIRQAENLKVVDDVEEAQAIFQDLAKRWRSVGEVEQGDEAFLLERLEQAKREFTIANADRLSEQEERRGVLMEKKASMALELESLIMSDDAKVLFSGVSQHGNTLSQIQRFLGDDEITSDLATKIDAIEQKANLIRAKSVKLRDAESREAKEMMARVNILSNANENKISWKDADKEITNLKARSKNLSNLSRDDRTALSASFSQATKDFNANRAAFFEKIESEREINGARKRALINDLPFYKNGATSAELVAHLNTSMESWKKIGPASREENDQLWDEYRAVRDELFARVKELRELEKDDFADRLASAFERKREALSKLEQEVSHDEFLLETMTDEKKAAKIKSNLPRQKRRIKELQSDVLDIQRKLTKMSNAKKSSNGNTSSKTCESSADNAEMNDTRPNADTSGKEAVSSNVADADQSTTTAA